MNFPKTISAEDMPSYIKEWTVVGLDIEYYDNRQLLTEGRLEGSVEIVIWDDESPFHALVFYELSEQGDEWVLGDWANEVP